MSGHKRPWFRFHLLTAVLMMIVGGVVMWANVRNHELPPELMGRCAGFPFRCYSDVRARVPGLGGEFASAQYWLLEEYCTSTVGPIRFETRKDGWCYPALLMNIFVSIFGVVVVALVSEFIIRRREGRQP